MKKSARARPELPVTSTPGVLSGAPVFEGTRVAVQTLFDYLEDGCSLQQFLDNFPSVSRRHAIRVLSAAKQRLVASC